MISYHPGPSTKNASYYKHNFIEFDSTNIAMLSAIIATRVWSPIVWENGRRKTEFFTCARFIALDFDDSELSLAQAVKTFCDSVHIIGTTKSHQKYKGQQGPCDRFRVVLKLTDLITNSDQYTATVSPLISRYGADENAKDGARFFYPCTEIVSRCYDGFTESSAPMPTAPIPQYPPLPLDARMRKEAMRYQSHGFSGWLKAFIEDGTIPEYFHGRNETCYKASIKMLYSGIEPNTIAAMIWAAPFSKDKFYEREVLTCIRSAAIWINNELGKNNG